MVRGYLIDFYVRALELKRAELAVLQEGDDAVKALNAEIVDLEDRMARAIASNDLKTPKG